MPSRNIKRMWGEGDADPFRAIIDSLSNHATVQVDLPSMGANTTGTQAVDVSAVLDVEAGDPVFATLETVEDGIILESAEATADGEITVSTHNASAGTIDPAAANIHFWVPYDLTVL